MDYLDNLKNVLDFSIIIPVYNTELFLKECLNSILKQNLSSYEIIIINDGSTDNSIEIIKEYSSKYSFIKYIDQPNSGQGAARNRGIEIASGEFIYFMDSDDILIENTLNYLHSECIEKRLDAVFFDGESFFDEKYLQNSRQKFNYTRDKSYGYYNDGGDLFVDLTKDNIFFVSPCLYIVKRDILIDNSLFFPEDVKNEDEYFTTNLMLYIKRCRHINNKLFLRRVRNNSTMTNHNKVNNYRGLESILRMFDQTYQEIDFKSLEVQKAYKRKMEQIFRSGVLVYNTYLKQERSINKDYLLNIGEKYNYFSTSTKIFTIISNNYKLYIFFKFLKDSLYRVRRLI